MKKYLRIKNWDRYQHYKDRNPPWIKLHRSFIVSETWVATSNASRVLAVAIMLLASDTENMIPYNKRYLRRVAYIDGKIDVSELLDCQFIEIVDEKGNVQADASTALADASTMQADARPETEAEAETETETETDNINIEKKAKPKTKRKKAGYSEKFEAFWKAYARPGNQGSKKKAYAEWKKLSAEDREQAQEKIPKYKKSLSSENYMKHAERYLRDRAWEGVNGEAAGEQLTYSEQKQKEKDDLRTQGAEQYEGIF